MKLAAHLPPADRERVEGRLHSNLMAWLTTVRPDGQPVTVPVWFVLREDETILLDSRPEKEKLRNIAANPKVRHRGSGRTGGAEHPVHGVRARAELRRVGLAAAQDLGRWSR